MLTAIASVAVIMTRIKTGPSAGGERLRVAQHLRVTDADEHAGHAEEGSFERDRADYDTDEEIDRRRAATEEAVVMP